MSDNRIQNLIDLAVKNQHFSEYTTQIHGKTDKGDGYLGRITFATVTGKKENGEAKIMNLVVKTATRNQLLRSQIPIRMVFQKEIYVYSEVIPAFRAFQEQMGFKSDLLDSFPVCYISKSDENGEGLVLEDIKLQGFDICDRKVPISDDHIKLVLQAFGKLHGFSFALKWKHPEMFKKLVEKNDVNMWSYWSIKTQVIKIFYRYFEQVKAVWKNDKKLEEIKFSQKNINDIFTKVIFEDSDDQVILHGDAWTNNFMFKREEGSGKPSKMTFIDWQMSAVASPVLDLSTFIYTCVDTEKHADVKEFLGIYHHSLSDCLTRFSCDPEKVFSFVKLTEHWKKYSSYGLILGNFLLRFCLADGEEAPDFVETAESGKNFLENFDFPLVNQDLYHQRWRNNVLHYMKNLKC